MPFEEVTEVSYTTAATAKGGRRGHVKSADGVVDLPLGPPGSTANPKANPETLFAAGYAACFSGALNALGRKAGVDVSESLGHRDRDVRQDRHRLRSRGRDRGRDPRCRPRRGRRSWSSRRTSSAPTARPPAATSSPRHAWRDVMTKGLTTMVVGPFVFGGGPRPARPYAGGPA